MALLTDFACYLFYKVDWYICFLWLLSCLFILIPLPPPCSILICHFLLLFTISPIMTGYEVPFICRLDEVNKLLDEKVLTPAEVSFEIARLHGRDSCRLHGNDPFAMSSLHWSSNSSSLLPFLLYSSISQKTHPSRFPPFLLSFLPPPSLLPLTHTTVTLSLQRASIK